ncbi:hypothetical protein Rsub_01427 [Raphidocelis subcapitata]|uniref:peptidyl-tRNA hydrolase n=1 Tax=Raphidocelis subcapitata TaxID=307507 RepID=A0A2V0NN07_9CHLO|nr:hypothetical protein Rsub_01427 [Raphidocelis subcapitata]|eukprot:GBF88928.1 hypothetical protein Rsub_01427 [Raphidocelis subcapitata]
MEAQQQQSGASPRSGGAAAVAAAGAAPPPAARAVVATAVAAAPAAAAASTSGAAAGAEAPRPYGRPPRRLLRTIAASLGAAGRHAGAAVKAPPSTGKQQQQAGADLDGPWLIVGLGNPGSRYDRTRHNIGFMVIDALASSEGIDMRKLEKSAAVGRGEVVGRKVLLAKPVTFMNNSGDAVAALARYYKVPLSRCLVVSDDLDQPHAAVRLRQRGGHGGHNGLRSIIDRFGGKSDFPRLKIGIGRPAGAMDVASYVLQEFRQGEMEGVDDAIRESIRIIHSVLTLGLDRALSGQRV